jgi:hypothetical protein
VQKPVVEPPQEVDRLEPGGCGPGWQCAGPPYNREEQPRRRGGAGGHGEAMQRLLPTDSLQFLMDLSIEPTFATLRPVP